MENNKNKKNEEEKSVKAVREFFVAKFVWRCAFLKKVAMGLFFFSETFFIKKALRKIK